MIIKKPILLSRKPTSGIIKDGPPFDTPENTPPNPPFDTSNIRIQNKFIVIVPVYNSEKYILKCVQSILSQTYKNYDLVVVDDKSTDNTLKIIKEEYIKSNRSFSICEIGKHSGSAIHSFKCGVEHVLSESLEDILVTVDGDDYLFDDKVLEYLNYIYQDTNIWMTYGQFISCAGRYRNFCQPISDFRNYRKSNLWLSSHLRTLKKKIWKRIKDKDLQDDDGNYVKYAGDLSYMLPALEMCGPKHTKCIDRILYVYNDLNPSNEFKICNGEDLKMNKRIRSLPVYNEIV